MVSDGEGEVAKAESFRAFVADAEPRLKRALVAGFGVEKGIEASADAILYGWEHWDRVQSMDNPAGYLYRVGQTRATRRDHRVGMPLPPPDNVPWIEPGLPAALGVLSEQQRTAVLLVHTFGNSFSETAELLGVSKATVQTHVRRALGTLRRELGVKL